MILKRESEAARTRAQRRASRTRDQLLNSALKMFADKGMEATTIEDITELADVGKGTFYRHFTSKREVVAALTEKIFDDLMAEIRTPKREPENLKESLSHLMTVHSTFFSDKAGEFFLLFQSRIMSRLQRAPAAELEKPLAAYLQEIDKCLAPHLPPDPRIPSRTRRLACALMGFIWTLPSLVMLEMTRERVEASMATLKQTFVEGALDLLKRGSAVAPAAAGDPDKPAATKGGC